MGAVKTHEFEFSNLTESRFLGSVLRHMALLDRATEQCASSSTGGYYKHPSPTARSVVPSSGHRAVS